MEKSPYSKKEIEQFRTTLEQRRDNLKRDIDEIAREIKEENPGRLADEGDNVANTFERGLDMRIREREIKLLRKVEKAIQRLDDGSYGQCVDCDEWIKPERLQARPVTDLCIDCKEDQEMIEKMEVTA